LKIDYDESTYEESLQIAAKMKDIQAVKTERRVKAEEAVEQRKLAEARAIQEAKVKAQQEEAKIKAQEALARKDREERFARDPYFQLARRKGWATDFMGTKRGKCKCKKCDFYCWKAVRLSS